MSHRRNTSFVVLSGLLLLGAAGSEDWVRRGNRAYASGEYGAALDSYRRAEDRTPDPGLVAFNKGAAYYQLEDFAAAADEYRRCLEDAVGVRRVRALYALGNSLVEQSRGGDDEDAIKLLPSAILSYIECLKAQETLHGPDLDNCLSTFADADHNLKIAKGLLEKVQASLAQKPPAAKPRNGSQHRSADPRERRDPAGAAAEDPDMGSVRRTDRGSVPGGQVPQETTQYRPGKGNLPNLLDDRDAPALDPDQAREHLQSAMDRIRRDRAHWLPPGFVRSEKARDW